MYLLHLSDLHFGSGQLDPCWFDDLKTGLIETINMLDSANLYLIVSGDITFKGSVDGYENASTFFDDIRKSTKIERSKIIVCPGNHDICRVQSRNFFEKFDAFVYSVRRDKLFQYSNYPASMSIQDSVAFLCVNSAYHLDHQYGLAPIDELRELLINHRRELASATAKIAVIHHHILNQFEKDCSAIRNAYQLICLLTQFGFNYLLHGHQHTFQAFPIGPGQMKVIGVSSFNYPTSKYVNGFNLYSMNGVELTDRRYQYLADHVINGRIGGFSCVAQYVSRDS